MYVPDPGLEYVISAKKLFIDCLTHEQVGMGLTSIVCIKLGKELVFDSKLEVLF